jgi:hypothetical protein
MPEERPAADQPVLKDFHRSAWLLILAALVVHATVILRAEPLQSANDRSRWCTVWSLLNRGTYQIDEIRQRPGWDTIDLVRIDGHFYSTKPPLMATWVAGVTWLVCRVTGWTLETHLQSVHGVVLLLVNALPFAAGLVLLARMLARQSHSAWAALYVLITAAFGTLVSPFLATLNNHTVAAAGVMAALACWWQAERLGTATSNEHATAANATVRPPWRLYGLWGLAAGWAACHDLPAAAVAAWMAVLAARRHWKAACCGFLPGSLLPIAAFLIINHVATGSILPAYAGYGGANYRFVHEGIPSYWVQPQGVDRNLDPPATYLFHCLLGHHGWFSLTPVFLLGMWGVRTAGWKSWTVSTLVLSAVVLGFYLTRTENYNYGGVSCGLRWAVFLTPLWVWALLPACEQLADFWSGRSVAALLLLASLYSAWEPAGRAWQQPWLFRVLEQAGWIDYRDVPPDLPRPLYSWLAELPEAGSPAWIEFERASPVGGEERLRVQLSGEQTVGARNCAVVDISRTRDGELFSRRRLLVDRAAFQAGQPPAACLVWTDPHVTPHQQQSDLAFFRGLPKLQPYRAGFIRYLKTGLRGDALPCQRAAAQVGHSIRPGEPLQRYRCDVWLCAEVPFGTARIEWTVSTADGGTVVQHEAWQVADCFPAVAPTSPVTIDRLPPFRKQHGQAVR